MESGDGMGIKIPAQGWLAGIRLKHLNFYY